ncbi:MAG: hypothetical protein ABSH38_03115 [Verrucomicrobiota bacterium]
MKQTLRGLEVWLNPERLVCCCSRFFVMFCAKQNIGLRIRNPRVFRSQSRRAIQRRQGVIDLAGAAGVGVFPRLPLKLWDTTRTEAGQCQSKKQTRKNQNLISRRTPMKPVQINGAAQNFSRYGTGVMIFVFLVFRFVFVYY